MERTTGSARPQSIYTSSLSCRDFERLSRVIYSACGINLPAYKKVLLESRLHKRIRTLKIPSLHEYCRYLFSPEGKKLELFNLIDAITTNKTEFFREPSHFEYIVTHALPGIISKTGTGFRDTLTVWSAGCSSGEEPYSLAMVLQDYSERNHEGKLNYQVLATDVSVTILKKAQRAIYELSQIKPVPLNFRKKYLLRGKESIKNLVRIAPELRRSVQFKRINFLDKDFGITVPVDIIFCRNVIIYFDRDTQEQVLQRICHYLRPGGFLFMGHSETLNQINVPLRQAAPTVYIKNHAAL